MNASITAGALGFGAALTANSLYVKSFTERDVESFSINTTMTGLAWGTMTGMAGQIGTFYSGHEGFKIARAAGVGVIAGTLAGLVVGQRLAEPADATS